MYATFIAPHIKNTSWHYWKLSLLKFITAIRSTTSISVTWLSERQAFDVVCLTKHFQNTPRIHLLFLSRLPSPSKAETEACAHFPSDVQLFSAGEAEQTISFGARPDVRAVQKLLESARKCKLDVRVDLLWLVRGLCAPSGNRLCFLQSLWAQDAVAVIELWCCAVTLLSDMLGNGPIYKVHWGDRGF